MSWYPRRKERSQHPLSPHAEMMYTLLAAFGLPWLIPLLLWLLFKAIQGIW